MEMKLSYLAVLDYALPIGIFNQLPWKRTAGRQCYRARCRHEHALPPNSAGNAGGVVYVIGVAYWLGLKERDALSTIRRTGEYHARAYRGDGFVGEEFRA